MQVVNAKEYVRRPEKLGLGATPAAMLPKPKKYIKQVRLLLHPLTLPLHAYNVCRRSIAS